ncbi:MAG: DUF1329 domain-containing protein [Burkholderiaceae bacterium]|nr:DUF1329 domain-containing protein [Burkholderiaceae bacterium]
MKQSAFTLSLLATLLAPTLSQAATLDAVDKSFFPYAAGTPGDATVKPGATITKANVEAAKNALDPAIYQFVKDGWLEIKVGPTTSFDLNKNYVEATRANLNKAKLGAKTGELSGFVAGRPFPEEPDAKDARAGEKLAWNFKYGINWGDSAAVYPFYWKFRDMNSGKIERTLKMNFHFLNYKHRVSQAPAPEITPNPSNLFRGIYVKVLEPLDVKDTQLLIQRYDDDLKQDDANLYLGFQRRVRRLATGQITDAFLGTDLMIEDFEGYNGRITDMNWNYKGTANVLLPFYNHNELKLADDEKEADGYKFVAFGGKGGCFPNVTWQLRKAYIVESKPADANHPISKRVHYMDAQTGTMVRTMIFDRKGELWKTFTIGKSHPDFHLPKNKGSGVAIDDAFSMVDVQAKHCTTGQFKGQVDPALNPANLFTVQNMRGAN